MTIRPALRFEVLRRDGFRCRYCGTTAAAAELAVDHVTPEALGGETVPENLVTACVDCNTGKGSTPLDAATVRDVSADQAEWRGFMARARVDADSAGFEAEVDRFDEAWRRWRDQAGIRLHRPPTWPRTIANYLADGLEIEELVEFVDIAMRKDNLTGDIPQWRYFCGCAKRRREELRSTADGLRRGARELRVGDTYRIGEIEITTRVSDPEDDDGWQEVAVSVPSIGAEVTFSAGGIPGEGDGDRPQVQTYMSVVADSLLLWPRTPGSERETPLVSLEAGPARLYIGDWCGVRHEDVYVTLPSPEGSTTVAALVETYLQALDDAEEAAARLANRTGRAAVPQPQLLSELLAGPPEDADNDDA